MSSIKARLMKPTGLEFHDTAFELDREIWNFIQHEYARSVSDNENGQGADAAEQKILCQDAAETEGVRKNVSRRTDDIFADQHLLSKLVRLSGAL